MPLTNFPNGVSSFGIPQVGSGDIPTGGGTYFFVDSVTGSNGNAGTWDSPVATIDYAIGLCTANKGNVIVVKPGHAETITAAGGITMDVAGVTVVGLGNGADRPEITFGTATTASIAVTAANCTIKNIVTICNIDAATKILHVQAADFTFDGEHRDTSSTVEAETWLLTTADAERLNVNVNYIGFPAGDAGVATIKLVGVDTGNITGQFYGKASTAWVQFATTACTNINVDAYMYNSGTTDGSKNVVDTVGGSTWYSIIIDGAAGSTYTGGSAAAVASDDITAVTNALYGSSGIATFPSGAAAANNVSIAEVLRYVQDQVINGTGTVLDTNTSLYGVLAGASGIPTFPAAAAAANNVSMAEVLRLCQDMLAMQTLDRNSSNYFSVLADFTSATWNTAASHEIATVTGTVHLTILPEVTGSVTSGGTPGVILGDETTGNSLIATGDITALAAGEWWFDTTYTRTVGLRAQINALDFVVTDKDIGYTIATAALTGGSITFHCWWRPISSGATVAAGAGGSL